MTRRLIVLVALVLVACGHRATAPTEVACNQRVDAGVLRTPAGDSVGVIVLRQWVCQ